MICPVYLYDTTNYGLNAKYIEEEIKGLRIQQDVKCHLFDLSDEGEVGYFLGIHIERQRDLKHYQLPQFTFSHVTAIPAKPRVKQYH